MRIDETEIGRIDVLATHFHVSRAELIRAVVRVGIPAFFEIYAASPGQAEKLIDEHVNWRAPEAASPETTQGDMTK